MACRHEHDEHCGHKHDDEPEKERGEDGTLFPYIDTVKVRCLNENTTGAARNVFKPRDEKLDKTKYLESAADEQLILHIPFTCVIKLKSICIIGGENGASPSKLKVYINREDIDFDNVETMSPVQEWDLQEDPSGLLNYPTRYAKFGNVSHLTLFFPSNFGNDVSRIYYVGLTGEATQLKREVVHATYELRPQASDHKNPAETGLGRTIQ